MAALNSFHEENKGFQDIAVRMTGRGSWALGFDPIKVWIGDRHVLTETEPGRFAPGEYPLEGLQQEISPIFVSRRAPRDAEMMRFSYVGYEKAESYEVLCRVVTCIEEYHHLKSRPEPVLIRCLGDHVSFGLEPGAALVDAWKDCDRSNGITNYLRTFRKLDEHEELLALLALLTPGLPADLRYSKVVEK